MLWTCTDHGLQRDAPVKGRQPATLMERKGK